MIHRLFVAGCLLLAILFSTAATAQLLPPGNGEEAKPAPADTLGRTTPRGTVQGFIDALASGAMGHSESFLEVTKGSPQAVALARDLRIVLDRKGRLNATVDISQAPEGDVNDGLPADVDVVGNLGSGDERVPLKLKRVERGDTQIWLISAETLDAVPALLRQSMESAVEVYTPTLLRDLMFLGVPIGDLLAVVVIFMLALAAGWLVALLLTWLASTLWLRTGAMRDARYLQRARWPLGLLLSNVWFKGGALAAGVTVIAREYAFRLIDIGSIVAAVWLFFIFSSAVSKTLLGQMSRREASSAISVARLLKRIVNAVALIVAVVLILDILGFDVTTGLAALGIGGIALALGAQKTIENLVGSVMLVADQPIRVGDFCQFEGVWGTVEDIGIRSTRVRTLEHTLVVIPNGAFSSMRIENWTHRQKYLFRHTFNARYETTSTQVKSLMAALHAYFAEHERVEGSDPSIRFLALGAHSIDIEVFVYVLARDVPHWWEVQGELLIGVMEIFEAEGVEFAFPSQTMYLARDGKVPAMAVPKA